MSSLSRFMVFEGQDATSGAMGGLPCMLVVLLFLLFGVARKFCHLLETQNSLYDTQRKCSYALPGTPLGPLID